jgi:hypothetical protein
MEVEWGSDLGPVRMESGFIDDLGDKMKLSGVETRLKIDRDISSLQDLKDWCPGEASPRHTRESDAMTCEMGDTTLHWVKERGDFISLVDGPVEARAHGAPKMSGGFVADEAYIDL